MTSVYGEKCYICLLTWGRGLHIFIEKVAICEAIVVILSSASPPWIRKGSWSTAKPKIVLVSYKGHFPCWQDVAFDVVRLCL